MGKTIDRICIAVAIFILTFIVSIEATHNSALSIIMGVIMSLVLLISITKITTGKKDKYLSHRELDTYMLINGKSYQIDTLMKLYPDASRQDVYIILNNSIIAPVYKFSKLSPDDVLKLYHIAEDIRVSTIYIISNNIDRAVISFANTLYSKTFHFIRSHELYKLMRANSLLPRVTKPPKKKHMAPIELVKVIFNRANSPRFLLTAVILLFVGIVTPMRNYYFVVSGISALLAIICIFMHNTSLNSSKLPPNKKEDLSHNDKSSISSNKIN